MSRSTFYYHQSRKPDDKYADVKDKIVEIFQKNKSRYGYRRVHEVLRQCGFTINHKDIFKIRRNVSGSIPEAFCTINVQVFGVTPSRTRFALARKPSQSAKRGGRSSSGDHSDPVLEVTSWVTLPRGVVFQRRISQNSQSISAARSVSSCMSP